MIAKLNKTTKNISRNLFFDSFLIYTNFYAQLSKKMGTENMVTYN